jgi:outer membrane protein assembly factor BamB
MLCAKAAWTWTIILGSALAGVAGDWPQFLGPNRNGSVSSEAGPITWPKDGPRVLWQTNVGEGFSAPVVVGNRLIIFHRIGEKEKLDCLESTTGKRLWGFEYPCRYSDSYARGNGPRATPAIADQKVFSFGAEGMLHCVALADGKLIWSVNTKEQFKPPKGFFGIACSPLVEAKAVLLNIGGKNGAGIAAFNKADGKVMWKATDDEASYSSPAAATINGRPHALFLTRNYFVGLDPENGKVFFEFPWQPAIQASVSAATPLVISNLVFISASYGAGAAVLTITDRSPQKVWTGDDILSCHYATPVHDKGFLFGFDGRQEQGCNLRCVELNTGKIRWSLDEFGAGTVTRINDDLLVLTERGELICAPADPKGFNPRARAQILPFSVRAYPAFVDGRLYARSHDKLVCLDLTKP